MLTLPRNRWLPLDVIPAEATVCAPGRIRTCDTRLGETSSSLSYALTSGFSGAPA